VNKLVAVSSADKKPINRAQLTVDIPLRCYLLYDGTHSTVDLRNIFRYAVIN
jgi:hypothetical protein